MGYTWDEMYSKLAVQYGGLPGLSTQDMLQRFWVESGFPDGVPGNDQRQAFYLARGAVGTTLGDIENDFWTRIGPNIMAGLGAVFAIDARDSLPGEQWVLNRGSGGQVLRARYGSVGRAEIRGGIGLVLPGGSVVGNHASVPSAPTFSAAASMSVRAVAAPDQAVPSGTNDIVSVWNTGPSGRAFRFGLQTTSGLLYLQLSSDGATTPGTVVAPTAHPLTDGARLAYRADWDAVSGNVEFFYKSTDLSLGGLQSNADWISLGSTAVNSVTGPLFSSSEPLRIGRHGGTSFFGGIIGAIALQVDGEWRATIDFAGQPNLVGSFVANTGQTVTVVAANAVDTNDPLWLPYRGANYVRVVAGGTTSFRTANGEGAAFDGATQLDLRGVFSFAEYPPSAGSRILFSRGGSIASNSAFRVVRATTTGAISLGVSDGTVFINAASFVPPPEVAVADTPVALRVTWDGSGVVYSYKVGFPITSALAVIEDSGGWQVFGSTTFTAPPLQTLTQPISFGSYSSASGANEEAEIYAGWASTAVGGAPQVRFTCNVPTEDQIVNTVSGLPMVVGRAAAGSKTAFVTRPVWLFGTDDYLEVADSDLLDFGSTDDFSVVWIGREWSTPNGSMIVAKASTNSTGVSGNQRWSLQMSSTGTRLVAEDGVSTTVANTPSIPGALRSVSVVSQGANMTAYGGTIASPPVARPVGSLANSLNVRIGTVSIATSAPMDMELLAVGIFRRALSADEIARIVTAYGAS